MQRGRAPCRPGRRPQLGIRLDTGRPAPAGGARLASAAVDLAAVGDASDDHQSLGIVDRVHDAVVADADPEVVAPGELLAPDRARVDGEPVDRRAFASRAPARTAPRTRRAGTAGAPRTGPGSSSSSKRRNGARAGHTRRRQSSSPSSTRRSRARTCWLHVVRYHEELQAELQAILDGLAAPTLRRRGRRPGEEWFYAAGPGPTRFVKVVVHYEGGEGRMVTAFPRRAFP